MAQTLDLGAALAQSDAALQQILKGATKPGLFGARRAGQQQHAFQEFLRDSIAYVGEANVRLPDELDLGRASDFDLRKTDGFFRDIVQRLDVTAGDAERGQGARRVLSADSRLKVNLARMNLSDALRRISEELEKRVGTSPSLPGQQPAPMQFDVVDGRILAVRPPDAPDEQDAAGTEAARRALLSTGRALVDELRASNCDRRLVEALAELQVRVADQTATIEIGILQIGLARLTEAAADELSPTLGSKLGAHVVTLGMYAAQFPSWRRFTENAALVALDLQAGQHIAQSAQTVARELEAQPHLADDETPRIIRAVAALIDAPGEAGKRAAFGTLRLLENLIAKIYEYGLAFVDKAAKKTVDDLATATAKVATGALLALAIAATADLTGVTVKVSETTWLKAATELAKKQLERLQADAAKPPPAVAQPPAS